MTDQNSKIFIPEVCRRKDIVNQLYIVGNDDYDGTQYQVDIVLLQRILSSHKNEIFILDFIHNRECLHFISSYQGLSKYGQA